MTFLAPWALVIGALAAAGMVALHLVARQRPAAYVLPTTRFVPDERTLVSRAATRPRDLLLLVLRVLLVLVAAAAFARPVLTPSRGTLGRIVLLDRSRAVASATDAVAKARALASDDAPFVLVAFDSSAAQVAKAPWDSLAALSASSADGSLSAALVLARRASVALAERVDSVELIVVSPLAAREIDAATSRLRAEWPGALRIERLALRADSTTAWRLERALPASDALGPAMLSVRAVDDARVSRLVRAPFSAADSAFARGGGTVVRWDSASAVRPAADGLATGETVVVASLGRRPVASRERTLARWADGTPAATESVVGAGCLREVGVAQPAAGDIALHPPFQSIVRWLLTPCGVRPPDVAADSAAVARLVGSNRTAASATALRRDEDQSSPLARWLLALALLLVGAEMFVRTRPTPEDA